MLRAQYKLPLRKYIVTSVQKLAKLADISVHCEYFVKYECLDSQLFNGPGSIGYSSRSAVRFIISSRAKRACITQASQGHRDFLLAINLSSLVGIRLDVIQSSDVKAHYGCPGNRLPSTTKLWVLFMKTVFFHL